MPDPPPPWKSENLLPPDDFDADRQLPLFGSVKETPVEEISVRMYDSHRFGLNWPKM